MSDIIDFKVLNTELYGRYKYNFNEAIPAFVESINSYLKKGYTFHGSTKFNDTYSVTQVLVKYKNPPKPTIDEYKLMCFAVEGSGSATVGAGPVVEFEKSILDELNDGWSLYSDTEIYRINESHRREVHYMQVLVKYKKPEINLIDM